MIHTLDLSRGNKEKIKNREVQIGEILKKLTAKVWGFFKKKMQAGQPDINLYPSWCRLSHTNKYNHQQLN